MNGLGDEAFARAVLARDQNVRIRGGRAFDELDHGPHRRRLCEQRRDAVKAQPRRAFELTSAPERPAQLNLRTDDRQQPRVVPGFLHEVSRAAPHGLDGHLNGRPRGQDDDRQRRVL